MSMFTLAISCLTTSNVPWFIPGSYAILFFIASDLTSIISHIHKWALFSLLLHLFILSGIVYPLFFTLVLHRSYFSSSILGTYWPEEFIFQCHIFVMSFRVMPFHMVHGVLKAIILKWVAIPFSSGYVLSELSTMTCLSWVALHGMAQSFIELERLWSTWSVWLVFCDSVFHSVCTLRDKDKRLMEASWWERLTVGATGSCSGAQ